MRRIGILLLLIVLRFLSFAQIHIPTGEQREQILNKLNDPNPFVQSESIDSAIYYRMSEIVPIVENKLWAENRFERLLRILYFLAPEKLCSAAHTLVDSAKIISERQSVLSYLDLRLIAAWYLMRNCGDYELSSDVLTAARGNGYSSVTGYLLLKELIKHVPAKADSAKIELKRIVREVTDRMDRFNAIRDLMELYGQGSIPDVIYMLTEDLEGSNRSMAFLYLFKLGYSDLNSLSRRQIYKEKKWVYRIEYADSLLFHFGSPDDYKFVEDYRMACLESNEVRHLEYSLQKFKPRIPTDSTTILTMLDTLLADIHQCSLFNWLGNQEFSNELYSYITSARNSINAGNQIEGARSIKIFQNYVDYVFGDSTRITGCFVSSEGWKFLHYESQYILDRLPKISSLPFIISIFPSKSAVNSNPFILSVRGVDFVNGSTIYWNNLSKTTTYVSDTILQCEISTTDIASIDSPLITVRNPDGVISNSIRFYVTPQISGCIVKFISSSGVRLTTSTLQYYEGSWKDAVNNNDGTFSITTNAKTINLRMTYEYGTQTKSNVPITGDTIVFQTVNTQIKLQNSQGNPIDTGTVQYYAGAWRNLGTTTNGIALKELLPSNYTFRMTYAFASKDKQQDIGSNPTVIFQTVNAAVQLQNSLGNLMDTGTVQYYSGAWRDFGTTLSGVANKELLPNNYSFRMTYAYASKDKQQDLSVNPIVVFQTVNAQVQLQNSQGVAIDTGTVQYYSGAWRSFGSTVNGTASKELLPNNYSFRMTYAYASKDKQQDLSVNPIVVFQTVNAAVQLRNSQGNLIDQGIVQYYSGAWRSLGTTVNGTTNKELLPNIYSFRMTHEYVSLDKTQDLSTNNTVSFSTILCTIRVKNAQSQPVDNVLASYYSGAWRQIGNTVNGEITKELLPANLTFRVKLGTVQQDKTQNLGTNNVVEFSLP